MDKLFTTKEAADFFGVTTKTVKNWRKSGKLVPCQTGENGYSLYSTEQLGKFKAQLGKKIQTGENQTRESHIESRETRENQTRENELQTRELGNLQLGNFPTSTGESGERKLGNFPTLQTRENDKTREKVGKQTRETGERNFDAEYLRLIKLDIANAQQHLDELPENDRRGLTLATYRHFHCGYNPAWVLTKSRAELSCGLYLNDNGETKHLPPPSPRIIIPTASRSHFNAVVTHSARLSMNKRYWKQHAGVMELFFDTNALTADTIFVVEGEFDAMSIWQASQSKIAAVAILGCMNWKRTLLPKLPELRGKRLILLLDADAAGNKASKKLLNELLLRGVLAVRRSIFDALHKEDQNFFGRKVDANDLLKDHGDAFLNSLLNKIIEFSNSEFDTLLAKINQSNPFDGSEPDIPAPIPKPKPVNFTASDNNDDHNEIRRILTDFVHAQNLSRDEWFQVGCIMKRYGFELSDFDAWSRDDSRYDANDCKAQWDSFKIEGELGDHGYKLGTLIELAKKFGYEPRHSKAHVDKSLLLSAEQRAFLFSGGNNPLANARRLEYLFGDKLRYIQDVDRWLTFSSGLWNPAPKSQNACLYPLVVNASELLHANAESKTEIKIADTFNSKAISYSFNFLKGLERIIIKQKDLDQHPELLNCLNGVVDLQTGKLMNADPELLLTQQCAAAYTGERNETVNKFLRDIMPDEETRAALIRWLAYCLTGEVSEEKAFLFYGSGGNGKGTLTLLLLTLFNEYATSLPITAVCEAGRASDAGAATTELTPLERRRLAIVEELPQGRRLDVAKFKTLTGGDKINIRRLHEEFTMIAPTHKIVISGNYRPELSDAHDDGLLRRLHSIDFTQRFTGDRRDPRLKKRLLEPASLRGLLTLLVDDAPNWYKHGLIFSNAIVDSTRNYFDTNDFISEFIAEHCEFGNGRFIELKGFAKRLREEYPDETRHFSDRNLYDLIKKLDGKSGIKHKRVGHKGAFGIDGIGWKNDSEPI